MDYKPFILDSKVSLKKSFNEMNKYNHKTDSPNKKVKVLEKDDYVVINGNKIKKPFVEKPRYSENHDIRIYYPIKEGGGIKYLFRKKNNRCSRYVKNENKIRRDGNYIYEEFLKTDGFDIKVYAIGLNYFHAEARKSPTMDGIV